MPYGRYRLRRPYRRHFRRNYRRNGYKSRSMFRIARRAVRTYAPAEKKFLDTSIDMSADDGSSSTTLLNGFAQGTTDITRIGNRVKFVNITMRLKCFVDVSSNTAFTGAQEIVARVALVLDKQPNGSAVSVSSIYESDTDPLSLRNKQTGKRYHVFMDKLYAFNVTGITTDFDSNTRTLVWSATKVIDKFKKFKRFMPEYNGSGATISSINTGALYLVLQADTPTANTPDINLVGEVRLRFIDA